jgi:hypothetical protein
VEPSDESQNASHREQPGRRTASVASILFFGLLAALGLLGASRAGLGRAELVAPETPEAHLTSAKGYRDRAATAQREGERHRSLVDGHGAAVGPGLPAALRRRCQRVAAAAAELAKAENELADYHEEQARALSVVATPGR